MLPVEILQSVPDWTVEQAEHWTAAALAEAKALRQHDEQLYATSEDPAIMRIAQQLHAAWQSWADAAEALYDRIRPLLQSKTYVAGAYDLNYAIGRTRAMLKLPPAVMLARQGQLRRGEVLSAEEVRRELRMAHRG